jgi:hypothetical protein
MLWENKELHMRWCEKTLISFVRFRRISWALLVLLCACAAVPQQNDWITVGQTTRDEVVEAYGRPDMVIARAEGEAVVYWPRDVSRSVPPIQIPTVQAGPLGMTTTQMGTIKSGMATQANGGMSRWKLERELRIRYDGHGIVQEVVR